METAAFDWGIKCREQGRSLQSNPYIEGSTHHESWVAGWYDQDMHEADSLTLSKTFFVQVLCHIFRRGELAAYEHLQLPIGYRTAKTVTKMLIANAEENRWYAQEMLALAREHSDGLDT